VLSASTDGKIGLQPYFGVTSGDVDAVLKGALAFEVPKQVIPGQEITVKSGFMLEDGSFFQTASPNVTLGLDLIIDFSASAEVTFDFGASAATEQFARIDKGVGIEERFEVPVDPGNGGGNGGEGGQSFDLFDPIVINETYELLRFTGKNVGFDFPFESPTGVPVGSFSGFIPEINTESTRDGDILASSGESDPLLPILSATADLDGIASTFIPGLPPLSAEVSASIIEIDIGEEPLELIGIEAGFDLFDVDLIAALTAMQDFQLSFGDLSGVLTLEDGTAIDYKVGDDITFTVPDTFDFDNDGQLGFGANLDVNGDPTDPSVGVLFDNLTSLNFALSLQLEAFSAGVDITSDLFDSISLGELGPVYEGEKELFAADSFATLFDDEFALIGFNSDSAEYGIDASLEYFLA